MTQQPTSAAQLIAVAIQSFNIVHGSISKHSNDLTGGNYQRTEWTLELEMHDCVLDKLHHMIDHGASQRRYKQTQKRAHAQIAHRHKYSHRQVQG